MMKRSFRSFRLIGVVLFCVLLAVTLVWADVSNPADAHVDINEPDSNFGSNTTMTVSSAFSAPNCTPTNVIYLRWDLSAINGEAGTDTELVLNVALSSGNGTLELREVSDDTWTEGGITWNNAPALGDLIASMAFPGTGAITFTGSNLAAWINENSSFTGGGDTTAGNDLVSFALRIVDCTALSSVLAISSRENTTEANRPQLNVFDTNAVTLATFHAAANEPVNWPLYAGLALMLAAVAAMSARWVVRRRA